MKQHKDEDSMEESILKIIKNDHETRLSLLEQSIININQTLIRIENNIKNLDNRIWMVFVFMVGGFGGILFALAQSLHWFK